MDAAHNYTGHNYDPVLGQYYAKARMYDAANKRFVAEDLIKGDVTTPQSLNPNIYTVNNPMKYVDPLGLHFILRDYELMITNDGRIERICHGFRVIPQTPAHANAQTILRATPILLVSRDPLVPVLLDDFNPRLSDMWMPNVVYSEIVGGSSFRGNTDFLDIGRNIAGDYVQKGVLKAIGNIVSDSIINAARGVKTGYNIYKALGYHIADRGILANDRIMFNIMDMANISTHFASYEAASGVMTGLQAFIDAAPDYFFTRIPTGRFGNQTLYNTIFCLDMIIASSDDPEAKIDYIASRHFSAIIPQLGGSRQNMSGLLSATASEIHLRKILEGHEERISFIYETAQEIDRLARNTPLHPTHFPGGGHIPR